MKRIFKCKGCMTYESQHPGRSVCNYIPYIKETKCPCFQCLIKSMCDTSCNDFDQYIYWLDKYYPHMLR